LVADYGIQGEKYQFDDQSRYWMVSGIFKWNLFSGFETSAKSQEMQAQINSLQKSSESLKQLINLEIQNNYYNYKNSYDQYDVAVKSYLSANENYDLNKKRYEEGLNPFISLLDAETTLKLTMENLYMTYYDVLTAKWKLNKSIGNLFK
jgi:outer membrane protein TolC